jgi:signal transduction histidine kinase/DNA-binding response OmpR family regulator
MIRLFVEALFALIFAQALVAYLRRRDPVERDVMAVFTAAAMLFALDVLRRFVGEPPQALRVVALVLLIAQPYLTLRLVHRVRPVPRWLRITALLAVLASVVPLASAPRLSLPGLLGVLGAFVAVQTTAAALLAKESRARTGAPRARFAIAAVATALFGLAILVAGVGSASPAIREQGRTFAYFILLVSAAGYVVAFRPPAWVRRMWSGRAAYEVSRQLVEAPATDVPEQTWAGYARVAREVSGADAVIVIPPDGNGDRPLATAGLRERHLTAGGAEVDRLLRRPHSITDITAHAADLPSFVASYAVEAGVRFLTAAPLRSPTGGRGALVLLNRRRGLFTEDEVRLMAELGGQAAIIAERGAVRDEQERLAQELARSVGALSAASQAKSDFLASMSHELRTPLNAIIGFSELMRGEEGVADKRLVPLEWIDHIYGSGRHLLTLINDILDLTKIEAGRLELRPEPVGLPALVTDTVNTLRPLIEGKALHLHTDIATVDVQADRVRLRQVLDNLLSNAIKFTPEGGRITVEVAQAGNEVRMAVVDTGVGIDPADQERIFDEFQQVGDVSMHQAGTGLGLALTRRLVEAHGGRVELESAPGAGSRFTVWLPGVIAGTGAGWVGVSVEGVSVEGEVEMPVGFPPADTATPGGKGGILLIEDEPSAARLLRMYLESAGYRVRLATTGEAGLLDASRERPDAVVLDVLLPGIDGWEVLRLLKQDPQLCDVPVFVASVVDERDVGLSLGAVDFFVKPIDRQRLLARVAEFLLKPGTVADRMHVLAVDDDPETLRAIAEALREQHVEVVTAGTGQEAVRLARTRPFDLIISDLLMPDIDGISLMSALDHDPETSKIPVLVLTGPDLSDADRSRLDAKALGILPKGGAVHEALHHWMTKLPRPGAQPTGTGQPEATT